MYLHIGGDHVVDRREIIGVFDIENSTVSNITREYLRKSEKKGRVVAIRNDMPKSFVVVDRDGETYVYLSSLSPATLKKRYSGSEEEFGI